jgi:hypothetical protein
MAPKSRSVKVRQEELESLLRLKSLLDHKATVSSYVEKYLKLGWVPQALTAQDGASLEVDFGDTPETWVNRLWAPALSGSTINLAVPTGRASGLFVLEVTKDGGEALLDEHGPWRSACVATLEGKRELHYYAWEPSLLGAAALPDTPEVRCCGEGRVAMLPPSCDPETGETWQWLCPPWENPPQLPGPALQQFLKASPARETRERPEVNLTWQEIYCLVSPHEPLLEALTASFPSMKEYCQGILEAAAVIGIDSREVLLALLWHAPRCNARRQPEIWAYVQKLVAAAAGEPRSDAPVPGEVPWELFVENALAQAEDSAVACGSWTGSHPGPSGCFTRRPAPLASSGPAPRTPFSCRKTEKI